MKAKSKSVFAIAFSVFCASLISVSVSQAQTKRTNCVLDHCNGMLYQLPEMDIEDWGKAPTEPEKSIGFRFNNDEYRNLERFVYSYNRDAEPLFAIGVYIESPSDIGFDEKMNRLEITQGHGEVVSWKNTRVGGVEASRSEFIVDGARSLSLSIYFDSTLVRIIAASTVADFAEYEDEFRKVIDSVQLASNETRDSSSQSQLTYSDSQAGVDIGYLPPMKHDDPKVDMVMILKSINRSTECMTLIQSTDSRANKREVLDEYVSGLGSMGFEMLESEFGKSKAFEFVTVDFRDDLCHARFRVACSDTRQILSISSADFSLQQIRRQFNGETPWEMWGQMLPMDGFTDSAD